MGQSPYDRFGNPYNVTRVLNAADNSFNLTAYDEYSPLYLTVNYAMTYLLAFSLTTCILVHTALYHGSVLLKGMKRMKTEDDDIHAKLMRYYPEVPDWWYITIFLMFFVMGLLAVAVCPVCGFLGEEIGTDGVFRAAVPESCAFLDAIHRCAVPVHLHIAIWIRLCVHSTIGTCC